MPIWTVRPRAQREQILGIVNESSVTAALDAAHERYGWIPSRRGDLMPRPVIVTPGDTQVLVLKGYAPLCAKCQGDIE